MDGPGYHTIRLGGDMHAPRNWVRLAIMATVAGAALVAAAFLQHQRAGSLYRAVQIAEPTMITGVHANRQRSALAAKAVDSNLQANFAGEPVSYLGNHVHQSNAMLQGGIVAITGLLLGMIGTLLMHKQPTHELPATEWAMTTVDAEDESLLPTNKEIMTARREFLRLQGEEPDAELEPGESLAPGEILRSVEIPGFEGTVDLVEMYKQFDELLGNNIRNPPIGTRITGTVFSIDDRGATVDFGGKSIGYCPLEELALCKVRSATDATAIGEEREFEIIAPPARRRKNEEALTLLSLRAIAEEVAWKRLQQYRENDVTFTIVLKGKNRGGYMVEVEDFGIPGFLPKSQATSDLATAPEDVDPSTFMDQVLDVKVLDLDPERKRLVVSQRAANPTIASDTFKVGTVHEGIVQNVKPYGIFVDVSGMSGLLHISQISHNRIENVDSIFKVGDKIKCMVLSQDQVQGRLALSTKRLEPTHGDMLTNQQLVYEKAEEMAERFREDIAAAEKRMQEFEAKLAEQNTVAFG